MRASDPYDSTVLNSYMLKVGSAQRADTYLTPLHYSGWNGGVAYEHIRRFRSRPFLWRLNVELDMDRTMNPVRNAAMYGAQFQARWSLLRSWEVCEALKLGAGGAGTFDVGALYQRRNGNNPVAANASLTIDLSAYATARFHIGRMPAFATYQASLPVVGAMFAPDYGQLYYEIYLGDRSGLLDVACWGRYFRLDQSLCVDLKAGPKYLRVGYGFDAVSTRAKGIVTQRVNHLFILGITL